jgi:hypothetical protein
VGKRVDQIEGLPRRQLGRANRALRHRSAMTAAEIAGCR